jgi:myo-inositol-1(or 4)-monophosphatase
MKQPLLNVALKAARRAGSVILRSFGRVDAAQISEKQRHDYVSEIDKLAEREIIRELKKAYPDHGFLAEESGKSGPQTQRWIIDPLDGTTNYLRGIPHFAISLAFESDQAIQHALVYDPIRDEVFHASKGHGAYLNDRRIRIGAKTSLKGALLGYALPFRQRRHVPAYQKMLDAMFDEAQDLRRMGAASLDLAYVASGRLDGFFEIGLGPWDVAAGALLVREAGGVIADFSGESNFLENGNVVAANIKLIPSMLKIIDTHATIALKRKTRGAPPVEVPTANG